jgi:UDP-3-O-[3-hydroxymyristoyl] N-acetylglucosamine deacetylase
MVRRTLAAEVCIEGIALHAGVRTKARLHPAAPDTGIVFRRCDLAASDPIPALWSNVAETRLGTVIANEKGASIGVIEHLMSALAGADIDDCLIEVDGPEPPILDGDAMCFLRPILEVGLRDQVGDRPKLFVRRPVEVHAEDAGCGLYPDDSTKFHFVIDFESAAIGRQEFAFAFSRRAFEEEIAPARTFGFLKDAEALRAAGLARGANLSNTLVIDQDRVVNADILRFQDEFVRHKILDAVGDMKLAGYPIGGRFEGRRSSHSLNNALLWELFANPANYEISI